MRLLAYCALVLLLASTCFADSLLVTASADGFIYPPGTTTGAKSFVIDNTADASLIAMANINNGGLGADVANNGIVTTAMCGKNSSTLHNILLRSETVDDSLSALDPSGFGIIDSIVWLLNISTVVQSGDSVTLAAYKLNSNRVFGEGASNAAVGLGCSWYKYDSTAGVQNLWTTAGSGTSDYSATEVCTTQTIVNGNGTGTDIRFKITSLTRADLTSANAGLVIKGYRYGGDDGTTSRVSFTTDDGTSGDRPKLSVYFHVPENNYGGAESLIVNSENGAKPVWTFDLSSAQASWDLDSVRGWFYILANYSVVGSEGPASVWNRVLKPINIGNNNGTQADAGEMHWNAWDERGSTATDSIWGTAGMNGTAGTYVNTCNRADTANAYDRFTFTSPTYGGTGTGWASAKVDTNNLRNWFDQGCNAFGLTLVGGVVGGDVGSKAFFKIEADEKAGSSNVAYIVIYYHGGATTRGTGRFGRDNTGVYRNDR